ncbi:hypothetical protein HBB16_13415 [Pseudonocardia sp. MCCB 268]|nr:hypothetical protein [Pseudonocardia cytotoxica]
MSCTGRYACVRSRSGPAAPVPRPGSPTTGRRPGTRSRPSRPPCRRRSEAERLRGLRRGAPALAAGPRPCRSPGAAAAHGGYLRRRPPRPSLPWRPRLAAVALLSERLAGRTRPPA